MEVTIYQKRIPKYIYDTSTTFKERIAANFDTLPGWVSDDNMILVEEMKKPGFNPNDLRKFQIEGDEFLLFWLNQQMSKKSEELNNNKNFLFLEIQSEHNFVSEKMLETVFNHRRNHRKCAPPCRAEHGCKESSCNPCFMGKIRREININKRKAKSYEATIRAINDMPLPEIPPLQKRESLLTVTVNQKYDSIESFFAQLECSLYKPVATCSSIFKIYDRVELPEYWKSYDYYLAQPNSVAMNVYIQTKQPSEIIQEKDYVLCTVSLNDDKNIQIQYFDLMFPVDSKEIVRRILSVEKVLKEEEEEIKGNYIFPCTSFHTLVVSDMIMNDPMFSSFMTVDESRYAYKKKGGLSLRVFLAEEEINCTLTSLNRSQNEDYVRMIPVYRLPQNGNFIRLYVKHARNIKILPVFINLFARLLTYYHTKVGEIVAVYKKYNCNVLSQIVSPDCVQPGGIKVSDLEIYTNSYNRQCQHMPSVIGINVSREKEEKLDANQTSKMTFPLYNNSLIDNNIPKHTYSCEKSEDEKDKEYKHIGLQVNKLENKDTYPYVPCCFKSPQNEKNSGLKLYMDEVAPRVIEKKVQQTVRMKKGFVGPNEDDTGILPKNLERLFLSMEEKTNYEYMRQGVFDTKYSFLECVHTAAKNRKPTQQDLLSIYDKLCNLDESEFAVASQEHPGYQPHEIRELFRTTSYLDPKKWVTFLEKQYTLKIIIFSSKRGEDQAGLIFPEHSMAYLQYKHPNPSQQTNVCVYEHYGVDMFGPYPRCELIVYFDEKNNKFRRLIGDTKISKYQQDSLVQFSYDQSLRRITNIANITIPFKDDIIESQFIDSYGKTRALRINDSRNRFIILTSPLPPLNKPIIPSHELYQNNNISKLVDLLQHYSLTPSSYYLNSKMLELTCTNNQVMYTIKVTRGEKISLDDVPSQPKPTYPSVSHQITLNDSNQKVSKYFTERRLALCMTEYFIYFYSVYSRNADDLNDINHLKRFMTNVVIKEDTLYDIPETPEISMANLRRYKFVGGDQFFVSNQETRRRLLYVLRNRLASQYEMVRDYHLQLEMRNFYGDLYHYATVEQKHTIVTPDPSSIIRLDRQIYDRLLPAHRQYLEQPMLGKCLLTEHETQSKAEEAAKKWNPDANSLIVYNSRTDVRNIRNTRGRGGVLVYKKDGEPHYLSVYVL